MKNLNFQFSIDWKIYIQYLYSKFQNIIYKDNHFYVKIKNNSIVKCYNDILWCYKIKC